MLLICLVVGFSCIDFSTNSIDNINAEEGDGVDAGGGNAEIENTESDVSDLSHAETPELDKRFKSAYDAYLYALNMTKKYTNKVTYSQQVTTKADTILGTVSVDVSIGREIYNDKSLTYATNNVKTVVFIGTTQLMGLGSNSSAYDYIDNDKGLIYGKESLEDFYKREGITIFEIPYDITPKTATMNFKDEPLKDYYELKMTLKPEAYSRYIRSVKNGVGTKEYPKVKSIIVTVKIDKTYGYFRSITSNEVYDVEYDYSGIIFKATCSSKITMVYNFNKDYSKAIGNMRENCGLPR